MTHSHKVLGFLLVAILGIYGCTRGPGGSAGGSTAALEAKIQRLEEDFRAAAAARDTFRQKLLASEEKTGALLRQLDQVSATAATVATDRDAARADLKVRTAERDNLQVQYESFRKNLRELIGQAEVALNATPGANVPSLATGPAIPIAPPTAPAGSSAAPDAGPSLRN